MAKIEKGYETLVPKYNKIVVSFCLCFFTLCFRKAEQFIREREHEKCCQKKYQNFRIWFVFIKMIQFFHLMTTFGFFKQSIHNIFAITKRCIINAMAIYIL